MNLEGRAAADWRVPRPGRPRSLTRLTTLLLAAALTVGCGDVAVVGGDPADSGPDAHVDPIRRSDAGWLASDTGWVESDAGPVASDAGPVGTEARPAVVDASGEPADASDPTAVAITAIEGDGSSRSIFVPRDVEVAAGVRADRRFRSHWTVRGRNLDRITNIELVSLEAQDQRQELELAERSNTMLTVRLPASLSAGLVALVAFAGAAEVASAEVFVLQGEGCKIDGSTADTITISCGDSTKTITAPRGATGARGLRGESGAEGPKGDKGDKGADGADGKNGTNGKNGIDGKNGTNGKNGTDGKNGANGASCKTVGSTKDSITITCGTITQTITAPQGDQGSMGPAGPGFTPENLAYVDNLKSKLKIDAPGRRGLTVSSTDLYVHSGNLYLQNGTGVTTVSRGEGNGKGRGKGNLIIGYNKGDSSLERSGTHYLIVGDNHSYSGSTGVVIGHRNTSSAIYASVLGGEGNAATGIGATVSGGRTNIAGGSQSHVSGGIQNEASGDRSSVSGGYLNKATGLGASVLGGTGNRAEGDSYAIAP